MSKGKGVASCDALAMPQFPCIHCGQPINADDSTSGTPITCPACHGSIFMPRIARPADPPKRFTAPPPIPSRRGSGSNASKSSSGALKVIIIGGVVVVFFLAIMGGTAFVTWNFIQKKKAEKVVEQKAETQVLEGMATDIEKLMTEMRDEDGLPKETDFRLKTGTAAKNDAERMREVLSGFLNDMAGLQNQYIRDLNKVGLQSLMDPDRLRQDTTFEETRKIVSDCRTLAEGMRQKGLEHMNNFPKRLDGQGFDEKNRRDIIRGYEDGQKESRSKFMEMWDLEVSTIEQMLAACEHLWKTKEAWTSQEGQFVFDNDPDLEKFNGYMQKIAENTAKQTTLSQGAVNKAMHQLRSE